MNAAIETRFFVLNMNGDDSIATARAALAGVPGFVQADFDLQAGTATIKGDVDPQAVAAALTGAGYPAVVKSA